MMNHVFPRIVVALVMVFGACEVPERVAVWVHVPEGAPIEAVAESLATREVIASAPRFVRFARVKRRDREIKPGIYPFQPRMPMGSVLQQLRRGTPDVVRVRVPPGLTLRELAEFLERRLGVPRDSLLAAAADSALRVAMRSSGPTLEGYLFPATYRFPRDATPLDVVRMMSDTFAVHWPRRWDRQAATLGLTRDDVVILASIVEGEGPHERDRHQVAAVYHNRLAEGMRLQADPTVVYALGQRRRLTFRDYRFPSPYNTYVHDGLPPAPINSPSVTALEAALFPARTEHLYLVARPDGRHVFSRTYPEHLAATRAVRDDDPPDR